MNSSGLPVALPTPKRRRTPFYETPSASGCAPSFQSASDGSIKRKQSEVVPPPCSWATSEPGPSYSSFDSTLDTPMVMKRAKLRTQRSVSPPHSRPAQMRDFPPMEYDSSYMEHQRYHPAPLVSSGLLSPLSLPHGFESEHLGRLHDKDDYDAGPSHQYIHEGLSGPPHDEGDLFPSPFGWPPPCQSLFSGPFSDDSDSDDGLSASTFSSPETTSDPEEVEDDEDGSDHIAYYSPETTSNDQHRYHTLDSYPQLDLYNDADGLPPLQLSFSSLSPPLSPLSSLSPLSPLGLDQRGEQDHEASPKHIDSPELPTVASSHTSGVDVGLLSPSMAPAPLPLFDDMYSYSYDEFPTPVPGSPYLRQSKDLPSMDIDSSSSNGLGFAPSGSSELFPSPSFYNGEGSSYDAPAQRTTWLSLPGADTDDDLIPADLASKNYIPDPGLAVPTTPPPQSLLIWDPTTASGLPLHLPVFDGSSRHRRNMDANDLPQLSRSPSPDEGLDVIDPNLLAELTEQDAEKGKEVQKVYDLRQRTTAAATAAALAGRNREGTQWEAERVKERWRELTALLRLKLRLDERASTGSGSGQVEEVAADAHDSDSVNTLLPSLAPTAPSSSSSTESESASALTNSGLATESLGLSPRRASSPPTLGSVPVSSPAISSFPSSSSSSTVVISPTPPAPRQPQRRSSSKTPKITSMAQLVANMVFHRQQDALRRSPVRNRTWPAPSCAERNSKSKLLTHATPRSPLRQMILPEDVVGDDDDENGEAIETVLSGEGGESPLQLSPLSLNLCASPEAFFAQLDGSHANPSAGPE